MISSQTWCMAVDEGDNQSCIINNGLSPQQLPNYQYHSESYWHSIMQKETIISEQVSSIMCMLPYLPPHNPQRLTVSYPMVSMVAVHSMASIYALFSIVDASGEETKNTCPCSTSCGWKEECNSRCFIETATSPCQAHSV